MKKVALSILKSLLLVLFIYYYVGNTAFIHTHTFSNYKITHSHPFLPGGHHTHNGEEVETIAFFNAVVAVATPVLAALFFLAFLRIILHTCTLTVSCGNHYSHNLRAPPVCIA